MSTADDGPLYNQWVLIVEDQYLIAEELRRIVTSLGGKPLPPCRELAAARRCLNSGPIDLALLDINLNGDTVFPFAHELADSHIAFMFITGYDDWMIPPWLRDSLCIEKPVTAEKLRHALDSLAA